MAVGLNLRPEVLAAKSELLEGRRKLRARHDDGTPGIQVCGAMADLCDRIVGRLWHAAAEEVLPQHRRRVALVAHAGYGRRDLAPYSDVDLMLLVAPDAQQALRPLCERFLRDLYDAGLNIGHSVRTLRQACQLAFKDATIGTSLMEHRFLAGSEELYRNFADTFAQRMRRDGAGMIARIEQARLQERLQFGETVYLLEPNIKRSQGGLRDVQLLRWVGFARWGTQHPDHLRQQGRLTHDEHRLLVEATEFLLRLRNEMHFHAGKSADQLSRFEQVRLAAWCGMAGAAGLLPVEQFMQTYFRHSSDVSRIVKRFVANARPRSRLRAWLTPLVTHQVEGDFRVGPTQISATARGRDKLRGELGEVLRLADLANCYNKQIDHATCEIIRTGMPALSDRITPATAARFMALLSQPARLAELLYLLHELGALEKILPEFRHAWGLLQFNEYHKYTVDEHCIRSVEAATRLLADAGPLGRAYRRIKQKGVLHLALLIHDIGKGYPEDHSEVGRRIAENTARRLHLDPQQTETLVFLVHKHLMMAHLAYRRDISDNELIVKFAVEVGSVELLEMLFVLTAADLTAVGPDVWNRWKAELLTELYYRALYHLAGERSDADQIIQTARQALRDLVPDDPSAPWYQRQIDALPSNFLLSNSPRQVLDDLRRLRELDQRQVIAHGQWQPASRTVEYTVLTRESITPGIFHKITGALSGQGLQILAAEINTLGDQLVLDRFVVQDPDYADQPPPERLEAVQGAIQRCLTDPAAAQPSFRKIWEPRQAQQRRDLSAQPPRVRIDNNTSDRYTILDVFASDRTGLLYRIARTIFELDLSVHFAKIGTYLDQVVDVFYVTDQQREKVADEARLAEIRRRLLEVVESSPA